MPQKYQRDREREMKPWKYIFIYSSLSLIIGSILRAYILMKKCFDKKIVHCIVLTIMLSFTAFDDFVIMMAMMIFLRLRVDYKWGITSEGTLRLTCALIGYWKIQNRKSHTVRCNRPFTTLRRWNNLALIDDFLKPRYQAVLQLSWWLRYAHLTCIHIWKVFAFISRDAGRRRQLLLSKPQAKRHLFAATIPPPVARHE